MVQSPLQMQLGRLARVTVLLLGAGWLLLGCSSSDSGNGTTATGQSCKSADQCYPGVKSGDLLGDPVCLDKVPEGYCTHTCGQDTDCCAANGECAGNRAEVCSPFESTGAMYCFLSCEDADVTKSTLADADKYCSTYAGAGFGCRSTGGGSKNRKVCMP